MGGGSAAIHRPPSASWGAEPVVDPRPLRVLIVDDNPIYTELLLRLLALHDWVEIVGCAANGRDAVTLASAASPDLVLMDIDMPIMDGVEAMQRIRERDPVAVLVLTASASQVDLDRARAAGALAVLPKATDPLELLARIEGVFLARAA